MTEIDLIADPDRRLERSAASDDSFGGITFAALDAAAPALLDTLTFGVVGLDASGRTNVCNLCESRYAALPRESVLRGEFF